MNHPNRSKRAPIPSELSTVITRSEWEKARRHGYTSVRDGQRYVLSLDKETQATMLIPVRLID